MNTHSCQPYSHLKYYLLILPMAFLLAIGCQSKQEEVELVFTFGPDDGGTVQPLIDEFNKANKGKIKVTWKEGSRLTDDFYEEVMVSLQSNEAEVDVIAADVIWTSALAQQGLVEDISKKFFEVYSPKDFIEAAMQSVTYQFNIWGVPWFTDAGMLYYRKDLLEKSGYQYPPDTWDELIAYSKKIMKDSGVKYGYVFQGAEYEGGVTNACEFIWNANGQILFGNLPNTGSFDVASVDPAIITINSKEAQRGLSEIRKLKQSGILPPDIDTYKEFEAGTAFQQGDAVFMRSWASAYGYMLDPNARVKARQVGLTSLPTSEKNMVPYSCLGGWNLLVNAKSSQEKKDAAWEFIQYMVGSDAQKYRALNGGILPSLRGLYADEAFLDEAPVAKFAMQVIPVTKGRPNSPYYMEISPQLASFYAKVLKEEISPENATKTLADRLGLILEKY